MSYGADNVYTTSPTATDDTATTPYETPVNIDVLANDSDPEGDPLSVNSITAQPSNGTATIEADGTITYTPDSGFSGTDSFTYEITDGNGNYDTADVTITVEARKDVFSRASVAALPTDTADLATVYSSAERTEVLDDDSAGVSMEGQNGQYQVHQFKDVHTPTSDVAKFDMRFKTDHSPATDNVVLQVFNVSTGSWETKQTYSTATVGSFFALSAGFAKSRTRISVIPGHAFR